MCLISAKYFEDLGWVLAKNIDLSYKPNIKVRKSFRRDIERLYLWDEQSKYTEGLNEYGVSIVSASILNEKEGTAGAGFKGVSDRIYYSPEGLRIRTALFERTALSAVKKLVKLEITGNTITADEKRCFVLEASYNDENGIEKYIYEVKEIPPNNIIVRSNHGILLPWTGYNSEIPNQTANRNSSEIRYEKIVSSLLDIKTPEGMLDVMSNKEDKNPQLNPLRIDEKKNSLRTTGQLIIIPSQKTLHYRPIWANLSFDLEKLNNKENKTYFELISNRKLHTFKESLDFKEISDEF